MADAKIARQQAPEGLSLYPDRDSWLAPQPTPWSWRCFFGLHHWYQWEQVERPVEIHNTRAYVGQMPMPVRHTELWQTRFCGCCGKMETELLRP